ADVVIPAFKVAVHPREDRGPVERLDVARQRQCLGWAAGNGLREGDGRGCLRSGPIYHLLLALGAVREAVADDDARNENRGSGGRYQAPPAWRFDVFRGHFVL